MTAADADRRALEDADDTLLVERAARGYTEALGELYDRHAGMLYGTALRLVGSTKEAEDIVQDVFVEAWRQASRYEPSRGSVIAWLLIKTRSRALDRLRRASVRHADLLSEMSTERSLARVALRLGEDPEIRLAVREALALLPEGIRLVLFHTFFLGSTARETAEHLSIPEGTVRSRLARGLDALEKVLEEGN